MEKMANILEKVEGWLKALSLSQDLLQEATGQRQTDSVVVWRSNSGFQAGVNNGPRWK